MSNIYDSANQIEREIRELQEFKALEEAYAKVKANEEAHRLFKDFQAMQIELQEKQMSGQEFSDEDAMKAQEMAMKIQSEEVINDLMQKEQQFSTIINDLNHIIMTPVRDLYSE
ncbi:YlbF family regulator [Enterococcus hirae]|nr:YlbF family regulator [Enterococcus hirae]